MIYQGGFNQLAKDHPNLQTLPPLPGSTLEGEAINYIGNYHDGSLTKIATLKDIKSWNIESETRALVILDQASASSDGTNFSELYNNAETKEEKNAILDRASGVLEVRDGNNTTSENQWIDTTTGETHTRSGERQRKVIVVTEEKGVLIW